MSNYYSRAMTNYDARLMTIRRASQDPAYRKRVLRKAKARRFLNDVVEVVGVIFLSLILLLVVCGFAVAGIGYVIYQAILSVVADVSKALRGKRGSS